MSISEREPVRIAWCDAHGVVENRGDHLCPELVEDQEDLMPCGMGLRPVTIEGAS